MSEENKRLATRFHSELFQGRNLAVADEILSEDFRVGTPGVPAQWASGREGAKQFASAIVEAFPDLAFVHHDVVAVEHHQPAARGQHGGERGDELCQERLVVARDAGFDPRRNARRPPPGEVLQPNDGLVVRKEQNGVPLLAETTAPDVGHAERPARGCDPFELLDRHGGRGYLPCIRPRR